MLVCARRSILISICLLGLAAVGATLASQDIAALRAEIAAVGGRVLVGIKPVDALRGMARPGVRTLSNAQVQAIAQRLSGFGLRVTRNFGLITAVAGVATDSAVAQLVKDPNVEYVVPDRIHRLQDERGAQRTMPVPLIETTPYGIATVRAPEAWAATNPANYGAGVKVGILDTGGDFDHEDLAYAGGFDAVLGSTAPADWDDNLPSCQGHGTHVAGTVGAVRGNALGVVGIAPDASIYAIQIFTEVPGPFGPECGAFTSDVIAGVDWAVTNGIQVVNMSYGSVFDDPAERAAYQAAAVAGMHLIAAAGNDALPASQHFPSALPEVIAVAATDAFDAWGDFSNFGPEVLVSAPGVAVLSTLPGNTYAAYTGTSMASPHVTGLVALLLALDPTLSNASLRGLLGAGAIDLGAAGRDDQFGEGRIDAFNSVSLVPGQQTAATQLALVQQPGNGTSGQPLVPAPVVELRDAQNQAVLQAGVVVTATVTSGPGRANVFGSLWRNKGGTPGGPPSELATTAVLTNASGQAVFSSLAITTVITAPHELTFSAGTLNPVVSAPFTVTGSVTILTNGVSLPGQAGGTGVLTYYVVNIPAGLGVLTVTTSGGTGDVDLAVRHGVPPTLALFDCASAEFGNEDLCQVANPAGGDWYIALLGYVDYADVTVTATASGSGATQLAILQQPQAANSGQPLVPGPIVELRDAQNQPVALAGVLVTAGISSGPGELSVLRAAVAGTADRGEQGKQPPDQPATTAVVTNGSGQAVFSNLVVTSLATADHELVFSGYNVTSIVSDPFSVAGTTPIPLTNGVPVAGLAGPAGSTAYFVLSVPAGQGSLTVTTTGGTGDADLYVKLGSLPTTTSFICRSFSFTNEETCTIATPDAGEWYVMVRGFDQYVGVTLTASYAAVATQLSLPQQPQDGASGAPLSPAPVVQLLDASSQPVAQAGVTITVAISSGPGQITVLPPNAGTTVGSDRRKLTPARTATVAATTNASGQATFSDLFVTTLITADHQLVFSSPNITPLVSDLFSVTATIPTALTNAVPISGLAGAVGSLRFYVIAVPAGQTDLTVEISGGNGDADLYVREGDLPTTSSYDCRPFFSGNDELCNFPDPVAGNWYILVRAFDPYDGVTLTATYGAPAALTVTLSGTGGGAITGPNGLNCTLSAGQPSGTCSVLVSNPSSPLLHAQQAAGSAFAGWGGAASSCALLSDCTVPVSGPTSVTAVFNVAPAYTATVVGAGTGSGAVTGGGINCTLHAGAATGTCSTSVDSGGAITLTAAPAAGQTFNGWTGACSGTGTCQLTMTGAQSVTADFSHPPADVTNMVAQVTGTSTLSAAEIQRWDCNATATFDIGDLLCYLDNHPGLTLSPQVMTAILSRSGVTPGTGPAATGRTKREN